MTKRLLSLLVATVMLLACFTFTASAEAGYFEMVSATLDAENFQVTFEFTEAVHIFETGHVWFTTRPEPSGSIKENNVTVGHDQYGINSVTYVEPTVVEDVQYSKKLIIAFNKPAEGDFLFKIGDPASPEQAGVRFVEYFLDDTAAGVLSSKVMRTADGKALKGNYATPDGVDIYWVPTAGWADAMNARGWSGTVNKYKGSVTMQTLPKPLTMISATLDAGKYEVTFEFSEAVHIFKTGHVWFCTRPEPAGAIKDGNTSVGVDQIGVKSVTYVEPTVVEDVQYSKKLIIAFNKPADGEFLFKVGDEALPTQAGVRFVEYFLDDTAAGEVSAQVLSTATGKTLKANYATGDGVDICWVPGADWANAMNSRGWGGTVSKINGGITMQSGATEQPETTQNFEIVSATLDTETFVATFTFSEPVRIMNQWQVAFSTRPAPSGEIKDNNVTIGYDQCNVDKIEYINPTTYDGVQYASTVKIKFAAVDNFIFRKGDPALLSQAGVRFMEYTDSTDHGNGTVSAKIIKSISGKTLKGNYAQGTVDIHWVPTEEWYDAMAERNWSYSNYTFDTTMEAIIITPEVSAINVIDASLGKLEFTFTSKVKLGEGYQIDVGGVKSVSVESAGDTEYDVSYIVDFGVDVSGKTTFSIPEKMFETVYGKNLGNTREGLIADYPLPSFDDISANFESGEKYSFMNTDTGRMLTVDGKTSFKLVYYASVNKYSLVDDSGKYVNLQTMSVQEERYIFDLVLNNNYERYQIIAKNGTVLYDNDTGTTNAAVIAYAAYGNNYIETGWYMTKEGDELPKKFVTIGDSITCGVIPAADCGNATVKPGYRKELSEKLLKEYGRVVFVGNLKHARGGNTTAIDNTLITDGFLYRHEGHSGWVIETGHYPGATAADNNRGIADLREGLQTKYAPDVFCMMIGINDVGMMGAYDGNDTKLTTIASRWETLVRAILEDLPEDGILLGASLTPRASGSAWTTSQNDAIEKLNAKYQAIIEKINAEGDMRIVKADNYTYVKNAGVSAISSDTIHLSLTGFTALANSYFDAYKANYKAPAERIVGDINGDNKKNADDAIYLLYNVFFGDEEYPLSVDADINGDNKKNADDAIYLLYNVFFGDKDYPLFPQKSTDNDWTGNY